MRAQAGNGCHLDGTRSIQPLSVIQDTSGHTGRPMQQTPLVTVALPLYRSAPFVDHMIGNLKRLSWDNLQIIVSDRHGADDAIRRLMMEFAGDTRFRFIQADDELNWVAHYNLLLKEADGSYFMWMPHDDYYPEGYVPSLVQALENDRRAIAAFGRRRVHYLSGLRPAGEPRVDKPPGFFLEGPWTPSQALRLLVSWNIAVPFRGLFRRRALVDNALYLPPAVDGVAADVYWMFCVCLHGPLAYVPQTSCTKFRHQESLSATWRYSVKPRHLKDGFRILREYVDTAAIPALDKRRMTLVLRVWTAFKFIYFAMARIPLPGFRDAAQLASRAGLRLLRMVS